MTSYRIEELIKEEYSKLNWLQRLFRNYPMVIFANDCNYKLTNKDLALPVKIKPSVFKRLVATLFIVIGLYFWLTLLYMALTNVLFYITISLLILVSIWTGFIFWRFFLSPGYSYNIVIDTNQLTIGKLPLPWNSINAAFIMSIGSGRHGISKLVIINNENKIYKFELNNFPFPKERILKLIDAYSSQKNLFPIFKLNQQ